MMIEVRRGAVLKSGGRVSIGPTQESAQCFWNQVVGSVLKTLMVIDGVERRSRG